MKTTIFIIIMLAFTYVSSAQKVKDSDVPAAVKTAFTAMYPDANHIKWSIEDKKYEAEYKLSGIESSALFESSGVYVQTETEIPVSSLPDAAKEYLSKNLPGKKIKEAAKITDAGGIITYEAEIGGTDYLFDSAGNFLSKATDTDAEDEKD